VVKAEEVAYPALEDKVVQTLTCMFCPLVIIFYDDILLLHPLALKYKN
jgi:hypothetical protein